MPSSAVYVRAIEAALVAPIRHVVLWPSIPLESQLLPFDTAPSTAHYGAFLRDPETSTPNPIGCLTVTEELCKATLPELVTRQHPKVQVQIHKFAVYSEFQGKGIGSALFRHVLAEVSQRYEGPVLLHLDARVEQKGWYERMGLKVPDEEVFIKRGPTGDGPAVEYIRLGILLNI
jgi:ribosomal protein S18 acetylase RimI-like enzyme